MPRSIRIPSRDMYRLKDVLDTVALDRSAARAHSVQDAEYVLDLSKAKYIDASVLLLLGGILSEHMERGRILRLALPNSERIADYLIAWRFQEYCEAITAPRTPFDERSVKLLVRRRQQSNRRYQAFVNGPDGDRIPAHIMDSLAIEEVALSGNELSDAYEGTRRYADRYFQSLLRRKMGKPAGAKIHDAIWECVRNAASHANANHIYTVAQFRQRPPGQPEDHEADPPESELQFAIWDDGAPFWKTLSAAAAEGSAITSEVYGEEGVTFDVRVERVPGGFDERIVLTDRDDLLQQHDIVSQRHLLTVAAFMLGVSSDPSRIRRGADEAGTAEGGVGLAIVRRTVLESEWGKIEYRTSGMNLSVQRLPTGSQGEYKIHIDLVPEQFWAIKGNLLTVTMPFHRKVASVE